MRLFVALDLPASAKAMIESAIAPARKHLPRARWVRAENLHLTLAFLGEVTSDHQDRAVRCLKEKLEQGGGFSYRIGEVGAFPPAGRLRVIWLGLEPPGPFESLKASVREALRGADLSFDDKPFRPHVTLARCDPPWAPPLRATVAGRLTPLCELFSRASLVCDRVALFASTLGPGGPRYELVEEFLLRPAPAAPVAGQAGAA